MYKCKKLVICKEEKVPACLLLKMFPTQLLNTKDRCSIQNNPLSMPCIINTYTHRSYDKM